MRRVLVAAALVAALSPVARAQSRPTGAALVAGVALRVPSHSRVALSVTGDAIQSIGGSTTYRPRLISGGLSLSIASASANDEQDR